MLRECWLYAAGFSLIVSVASSVPAQAFQGAKVGPSGATLFASPKSSAAQKAKLPAGSVVNVMEPSEKGFYRATTAKGQTGWILESALIVSKHTKVAEGSPATPPPAAVPAAAVSERPMGIYVGALGGVGVAGGGSSFTFGLDLGYRMSPMWSLGAYVTYLNLQSATGATSTAAGGVTTATGASLLLLAAEANYHVPQVPELHFGGKIGLGISSQAATASVTSSSTQAPAFAGTAGYDYPVTPMLSLGAEANFFYVAGDIATTVFNGLGAVKFTF
jgi:hypothetical protein